MLATEDTISCRCLTRCRQEPRFFRPSPRRHTFHFAAHLPPFMSLCINAALLAMDASLVHRIR